MTTRALTDDALQAAMAVATDGADSLALVAADVARARETGGRAPSTLTAYRGLLRQARAWALGTGHAVDALTDDDVAILTASALRGGAPGWPRPVGVSRVRVLHAALAHAYASRGLPSPVGHLSSSVLRDAQRNAPPSRSAYALTPDELRRCIRVAEQAAPWWAPGVLAVGWAGALRAGELRQCAGAPEMRGTSVVLPIVSKGKGRLVRLASSSDADVCGARWAMALAGQRLPSVRGIHDALRRVFSLAGIPVATPHSLRVGWATAASRAGIPLASIVAHLGHADARPTQRYVSQATLDALPALV